MSELPAITTAPAPGRNFIQVYTKLSTRTISLGFWGADLSSQRVHDIDSSANDALTLTTPKSQITDVEFYGATAVLGFVPQPDRTRHTLAFLSPAFKLLPADKTTTAITSTGLAGLNTPGEQGGSYLYYASPTRSGIREYNIETEAFKDLPAAIAPSATSPLAAYHHAGGGTTATVLGKGRYVIYIDSDKASIKEALVSSQTASTPVPIISGAAKFHPDTGLAVVFVPTTKRTYLYYVGPDHKLMRVVKKPSDMKWDAPLAVAKVNHDEVQAGAQLAAVFQKDNVNVFWPTGQDVKGLGHGFDDVKA
ncbi:hypothetical protein B0T18DRAFT_391194 [Schizothecium vesticola]|uniref:Uncharacterized protein n=1 Tax=Schizothecium vesticola TaxID=314040 RepID=A0AA40EWR1_9PEZI|nr:hypothetical protein B0T18DRAFT_391194 [Schizothecium vesticola]